MKNRFRNIYVSIFCFLFFITLQSKAQNQKLADSLIHELNDYQGTNDTIRFYWLTKISFNHNNPDSCLYYALVLASETNDPSYLHVANYNKGSALRLKGDLDGALEAYFKSIEYAQLGNDRKKEGLSLVAIGDVYSISGAYQNSLEYYSKSITILRESKDSLNLANGLLNLGDHYFNNEMYEEALLHFQESGIIFNNISHQVGTAYNLGNVGIVYAEQGKDQLAEKNIQEAIRILENNQENSAISVYLTFMADIYVRKSNMPAAIEYAKQSLSLSKKYKLKNEISEANLKLSELYEIIGDQPKAYNYYKEHITYRDSVNNLESVQKMADIRRESDLAQKQAEVDLLDVQKSNQQLISLAAGIGVILILIVAVGLYKRNNFIAKGKLLVENEKKKSDLLLLNILPEETAKELKENGKVLAKKFESVSVLFTDFAGFTQYSSNLSPEALIESVNYYYSKFDEIMEKYGLEKIKTVGDAYMAAGGLPFPSNDHALKLANAAVEIAEFVKESKKFDSDDMTRFDIRIGIHTGPVVAGVVGTKKFAYDIWGDTVNIASRMESNSEPGKINISESTYELVKDHFNCFYRGEIEAKNRGKLKMYFVEKAVA